jgi:hypothetical protein
LTHVFSKKIRVRREEAQTDRTSLKANGKQTLIEINPGRVKQQRRLAQWFAAQRARLL